MSIKYMVLGYSLTTFVTQVSSYNHKTRVSSLLQKCNATVDKEMCPSLLQKCNETVDKEMRIKKLTLLWCFSWLIYLQRALK